MPGVRPRRKSVKPSSVPIHTNPDGMDFEKRSLYIAAKSIVANMIADGALDYGLSFYAEVTTYTDTTHFKASGLANKGAGFFIPNTGDAYEIYVVQADGAAPEGQHKPVLAYTTGDGTFQHAAFTTDNLATGDIILVIHPWLARLLDLYTDWKDGGRLDLLIDAIITDIASAVPEPPTAKSLQDILHKDNNFTWIKSTDALQAISDDIDQQHLNIHILFIIPEAVGSITADNTVLQTELLKLGDVHTITQGDALEFPAFGSYAVAVLGSSSGTAWTTSNLVDLKNILGLTLICVDKACAAYFEIGTDGGDAAAKTVVRAISEIEGTKMGEGDANHQSVTGIDAGNNTVSSSATYHTLDMSNANITETVFCTEANDPDGATAKEDVVLGIIRRIQNDGSIGVDEAGADIPATLGFAGFAYEGNKLTTLGKALFLLFCHMLIQLRIQEQSVETGGLVADLRKRIFGNMKGSFTNTAPLVEYIAGKDSVGGELPVGTSLPDLVTTIDGIVDTLLTRITAAVATATALATHESSQSTHRTALGTHDTALTAAKAVIDAIKTIVDTPANFMADLSTLETRLSATRAGYLDNLSVGAVALEATLTAIKGGGWTTETLKAIKDAIDAIPAGGDATEAKQDIIDTVVDGIQTDLSNVTDGLGALKALLDTITGYLTTEIADILTDTGTTIPGLLSTVQADLDNPSQYKADLSTLETRLSAARAGYLDELDFALQEAIAALPATMVGTDDAALASVLGALNAATATGAVGNVTVAMGYLKQLVTKLRNATDGLGALKTLIDAVKGVVDSIPTTAMRGTDNVVLSGPTKAEMDTGHGLLTTPAEVAAALNTYDAVKRSEATSDKDAIIAAIPAMVGTDNAATEAKQDIIDALVDSAEAVGPMSYLDAGGEQTVKEDTATTRRRIWLEFSNRNMTQSGKFILYRKVDGSNYDIYVTELVTVGASDDRAFDVEFTTNQAWKLTYTEDSNEGAARAIPFNVITQVIE